MSSSITTGLSLLYILKCLICGNSSTGAPHLSLPPAPFYQGGPFLWPQEPGWELGLGMWVPGSCQGDRRQEGPTACISLLSLFSECHALVPYQHYYEACLFDSCTVPEGHLECASLQAYAILCAHEGVCIDWRNHTQGVCCE